MQRRSLLILTVAIPALWFCLGESSGARWVREETWPDLQKAADVIVIVTVTSTKDLPKDDTKDIQAQESQLRVLTALKGQNVPPNLRLLHYRYKSIDEPGSLPFIKDACHYLKLKTTPEEAVPPAPTSNDSRAAEIIRRRDAEMPSREGQYLMFLTRQADGRMVPVTRHCDPANSLFALTKAETVKL